MNEAHGIEPKMVTAQACSAPPPPAATAGPDAQAVDAAPADRPRARPSARQV